jgi:lysozyme
MFEPKYLLAPEPPETQATPETPETAPSANNGPSTTPPIGKSKTNTDSNSCATACSDRHGKPWSLSTQGMTFIAVLESGILNGTFKGNPVVDGFILKVYNDGYNLPTVGLGHLVVPQDNLKLGDTISIERARDFFKENLKPIEDHINRDVKVPLHQHEYDALVSILFNTGAGRNKHDSWPGTRSAYLAGFLNKGEYDKMPTVIEGFVAHRAPKRRKTEARLFKSGNYDAKH